MEERGGEEDGPLGGGFAQQAEESQAEDQQDHRHTDMQTSTFNQSDSQTVRKMISLVEKSFLIIGERMYTGIVKDSLSLRM